MQLQNALESVMTVLFHHRATKCGLNIFLHKKSMIDVDHIFILCDPHREPARAAYLQSWLTSANIPESMYTMRLECYGDTIDDEYASKVYDPWQQRSYREMGSSGHNHNLKKGEISLVLNWRAAAVQAIAAGYKKVLFLESDVIFFPMFVEKFNRALASIDKDDWDFLSISAGANLRPSRPAGETTLRWFKAPFYYHTRTTDAMVFKVEMLEKIVSSLFPFADVLDWELNYQLTIHNSRSFWLDPPLLEQGSGRIYPTTL